MSRKKSLERIRLENLITDEWISREELSSKFLSIIPPGIASRSAERSRAKKPNAPEQRVIKANDDMLIRTGSRAMFNTLLGSLRSSNYIVERVVTTEDGKRTKQLRKNPEYLEKPSDRTTKKTVSIKEFAKQKNVVLKSTLPERDEQEPEKDYLDNFDFLLVRSENGRSHITALNPDVSYTTWDQQRVSNSPSSMLLALQSAVEHRSKNETAVNILSDIIERELRSRGLESLNNEE